VTDPAELSATELLAAYRDRTLSPVEATRAVLDRIEAVDGTLHAYCLVDADGALTAAEASEERWRRRTPLGAADGVPTAIKDMLLTRGWPTLRGSHAIDPAGPWEEDAPAVARLREHGAVLVGKTTTPEMAWKGVTDSPLTGVTRNPWAPDRTPGGSSGGSAAAVAAGLAPWSIGTDGGGSIRIPAAFTGTFGLKPTYGRVPIYPASPFGTLAHAGPMTRTVADAALLLDIVSGPDPRDWSASAPPAESFVDALEHGVAGLRVAYSPTLGFASPDSEVRAAVDRAAAVLAGLGARVEEVDPGFDDPVEAFACLWYSGAAKVMAGYDAATMAGVDPGLAQICAEGAAYSALDYLDATALRMALGVRMGLFHQAYDLLLTPAVPIPAFEAGREVPPELGESRWMRWTPYTYPFNLTQQPAASVPCGFTGDGLPIGLQVVGARHADALVLAACRAYEQAAPWPRLAPVDGLRQPA